MGTHASEAEVAGSRMHAVAIERESRMLAHLRVRVRIRVRV